MKNVFLSLQLDTPGEAVLHSCIFREETPAQDFHGGDPMRRSQFGQISDSGRGYWRRVSYRLGNPTLDNFKWEWSADSGLYPDQYQRDRMIQIQANHPAQKPWPDHGYSSWIQRGDGSVYLVDYSNAGDVADTAHLIRVMIEPADIA